VIDEEAPAAPHRPPPGISNRRPPPATSVTALAYATLAVPFAVILVRIAVTGTHGVFLPDDLALVDLHTRVALHWQQSVGPFDRFGWNHPGPTYYYLLSIAYRILGNGPKAAYFGATVVNLLAAVGVVGVCRRRGGASLALWAAACVGVLELLLAINSAHALTYSESVLGAAVSPWTATVIIVPLLLFVVLCAAIPSPSPLSAIGALLVGSFVVQTDLSAAPLVIVLFVVASVAAVVLVVLERRRQGSGAEDTLAVTGRPRGRALLAIGVVVLAGMWIAPIVQNITTHPGNLDLIYRFFTSPQPVHPLSQGFLAVMAVDAVTVFGPGEIMSGVLGRAPVHAPVADLVFIVVVLVGLAAVTAGRRRGNRFAVTAGSLSLVGLVAMVFAFSRISGLIYGYLVLWEITLPVLAVLGLGAALLSSPLHLMGEQSSGAAHGRSAPPWLRPALTALAVVVSLGLCVRMAALPSVSAASDPHVGAVLDLATAALPSSSRPVFVGDGGLDLLDTEEFIGVVNQFDVRGYDPKVNHFWRTEFGSSYVTPGGVHWHVVLLPWAPTSPALVGYVGKVGDIAVTVTHR
jgi:hypothetical protein